MFNFKFRRRVMSLAIFAFVTKFIFQLHILWEQPLQKISGPTAGGNDFLNTDFEREL